MTCVRVRTSIGRQAANAPERVRLSFSPSPPHQTNYESNLFSLPSGRPRCRERPRADRTTGAAAASQTESRHDHRPARLGKDHLRADEDSAPAPATPRAGARGRGRTAHQRFEAVGNTTVASDTIRVYLGVDPGEPYDPAALQRNFLNLWQTGLFDDIRLETDNAPNGGIIVRAVVNDDGADDDAAVRGRVGLDADVVEEAGLPEVEEVLLQRRRIVRVALVDAKVNADRVAGNGGVANRFEAFDALPGGGGVLPGRGVTGGGGPGSRPVRR